MADDGVGFSRWMTLSNKERAAGGRLVYPSALRRTEEKCVIFAP
jgi:hypothetical protein